MSDPIISGTAVTKRWGATSVLTDATFRITPGVTGLLGANGAGKTTLLGMVLGLHHPDSGQLRVLGLDPAEAGPDVRQLIGYSPEHHTLPPDTQAFDLVRHIAELHGLPRRDATNRASDALYSVGLGEERLRPIGTMSTGQRQRVKLAQAIAHDPRLVLLDEPTDGLDPIQRDQMLELIRRCAADFGINVVLSSHLLEEVERICDAVVILGEGRVIANAPIDDLRGSGTSFVVEVDHGADQLAHALASRGLSVTAEGRRVVVAATDDLAFDLARDEVVRLGLPLRRLERRRLSLEDVFLEMLGVSQSD